MDKTFLDDITVEAEGKSGEPSKKEETKKARSEISKGGYSGVASAGFSEFLLRAELLNAIQDCGFEHPSEV